MGNLTHTVSGDIANFRSAARVPIESLKCHFKPKQDLHGYSKPWPGGGGKNLFNINATFQNPDNTVFTAIETKRLFMPYTYCIGITGNNYFEPNNVASYSIVNGVLTVTPVSMMYGVGFAIPVKSNTNYMVSFIGTNWRFELGFYESDGTFINFNYGSITEPFQTPENCAIMTITFNSYPAQSTATYTNIQIEEGTSATSYEPYENICPITGWNQINPWLFSNNLIEFNLYTVNNYLGVSWTTDANGLVTYEGTPTSWSSIRYGTVYLNGRTKLYGKIFGDEDNVSFNTLYVYDSTDTRIAMISTNWEKTTHNNNYTYVDLGEYPTATYVTIGLKRAKDNIYMKGQCYAVVTDKLEYLNIPITFPTTGKNKLNPADIYIYDNHFTLENSIYTNNVTDTRTYTQLAVQLWKSRSSYIKTLRVDYLQTTGRHTLTFTVDDPNGKYLCLKHNGTKKDFILLLPIPLGLREYTISVDLLANDPTIIGGVQLTNIQLEVGDVATEYEPYVDNLDNTIYGGYVDIATGEIVKEYDSYTFTGIQEDELSYYNTRSSGNFLFHVFRSTRLDRLPAYTSSLFGYYSIGTPTTGTGSVRVYIGTPTHQIIFQIQSDLCEGTVESFSNWLSTHPLQIVYKLKEPLHYPLSKTEVKTFLDQNQVWSNTNDITEVTYQIHDSNMIQQAKKNIMAENQTHYKKVLWNNLVNGYLSANDWIDRNPSESTTTFSDGVATTTYVETNAYVSYHTMRCANTPNVYLSHQYYIYAEFYLNNDFPTGYGIGFEFAGGHQLATYGITNNTWNSRSFISSGKRDGSGYLYLPFITGKAIEGLQVQTRNVLYIDLTAMFGFGNEPTTPEEFEYLCQINHINLSEPHAQDSGTLQLWCIPNHNTDKHITIEWNQYAKPINENNYALHTASAASATFEDGVATRTIITETTSNNCYITAFRSNYTFPAIQDHIYYAKEELNSEVDKNYVISYANNWHVKKIIPNQWSIIEDIFTYNSTGNKYIYLCYRSSASDIGETCSTRKPILIDLTRMFGAGNEPTTPETLRAMCLKNNINLDEPQSYNTGTKMIWKV